MKQKHFAAMTVVAALFAGAVCVSPVRAEDAAQAEKAKAMQNPYPNDFGPAKLADVSSYNPEQQQGYNLILDKCSRCHSSARVFNSQFVDLKPEELAALKAKQPEIFQDKLVWQAEPGIWQRYIKRMMSKPGCNIADADGRKIFRFLQEYSKREKTGAKAAQWSASRKKLLADFKQKYPARSKELFGQ
jgi:hypothetical protein